MFLKFHQIKPNAPPQEFYVTVRHVEAYKDGEMYIGGRRYQVQESFEQIKKALDTAMNV